MTSPWSSNVDPGSIWNSNSPNLNLLRRYSLRQSVSSAGVHGVGSSAAGHSTPLLGQSSAGNSLAGAISAPSTNSTCTWEPSVDNKYLIAYIVISRQDLELYNDSLGFQLGGGKATQDGQHGAIVEHVVPGSLMNIVCKIKVGDEIVEWNGFNLRNKRSEEVSEIVESNKGTGSLRLVAIRAISDGPSAVSSVPPAATIAGASNTSALQNNSSGSLTANNNNSSPAAISSCNNSTNKTSASANSSSVCPNSGGVSNSAAHNHNNNNNNNSACGNNSSANNKIANNNSGNTNNISGALKANCGGIAIAAHNKGSN